MKFEEAIAAMREGKRCRCSKYTELVYFVKDGTLFREDRSATISAYDGIIDADWSIVEPPPPLPRLFRAKYKGEPIAGAEYPKEFEGDANMRAARDHCTRIWFEASELTDLEYINVP